MRRGGYVWEPTESLGFYQPIKLHPRPTHREIREFIQNLYYEIVWRKYLQSAARAQDEQPEKHLYGGELPKVKATVFKHLN
jgi:hypothetical protein